MATATAIEAIDHAAAMRATYDAKRVAQAVAIWEHAIGELADEYRQRGEGIESARTTARAAYAILVDRVQEAGRMIVIGDWCYEPSPDGSDIFCYPYF